MRVDLKNSNLTLIQLLAAMLVVYYHSFPLGDNSSEWIYELFKGQMMDVGSIAVGTFLFISGFLVSRSLPPSEGGPGFFGRLRWVAGFAVKRFLRVFPPIAFAVLLAMFVIGPLLTSLPLDQYFAHRQLIRHARTFSLIRIDYFLPGLFEDNVYRGAVNGSLWVIPWQVLCYMSIAVVGMTGLGRNRWVVSFVLICTWAAFFMRESLFQRPFLWLNLRTGLQPVAFFATGWWASMWADRIRFNGRIASLCAIALVLLQGSSYLRVVAFAFLGGYCLLYLAFAHPVGWIGKLPQLSLAIFVLAFPIQQVLTAVFGGRMFSFLNFILTMAIVIPLAWFEYRTVERCASRVRKVVLDWLVYKGGAR